MKTLNKTRFLSLGKILLLPFVLLSCQQKPLATTQWVSPKAYSKQTQQLQDNQHPYLKTISPYHEFNQIIRHVHSSNFELKISILNTELSQIEAQVESKQKYPNLNLSLDSQKQWQRQSNTGKSSLNSQLLNLNSSWEIDLWKKLDRKSRSANINTLIKKEAFNQLLESILFQCLKEYLTFYTSKSEYAYLDKKIEIEKNILKILKNDFNDARSTFKIYQKQKNKLLSLEQLKTQKETSQANSKLNILHTLGGKWDNKEILNSEVEISAWLNSLKPIDIGVPAHLIENRPDIKAASSEIKIFVLDWENKSRSLYPNLTIKASLNTQDNLWNNIFNPNNILSIITGQLTQPLFNRHRLKAQKKVSAINLKQSIIQYSNKFSNAILEVESHLMNQQNLRSNLKQLNLQISNSKDTLSNLREGYQQGLNPLIEILGQELENIQLLEKKLLLSQSIILEHYSLLKSLGSRWQLLSKTKNSSHSIQNSAEVIKP
jgi:outer membrane protein TolC